MYIHFPSPPFSVLFALYFAERTGADNHAAMIETHMVQGE